MLKTRAFSNGILELRRECYYYRRLRRLFHGAFFGALGVAASREAHMHDYTKQQPRCNITQNFRLASFHIEY